jgi:hypothetical protein
VLDDDERQTRVWRQVLDEPHERIEASSGSADSNHQPRFSLSGHPFNRPSVS